MFLAANSPRANLCFKQTRAFPVRAQALPEVAKRVPSEAARPMMGAPQIGLTMDPEAGPDEPQPPPGQRFALKKKASGKGSGRFPGSASFRSSVIVFNGGRGVGRNVPDVLKHHVLSCDGSHGATGCTVMVARN